MKTKTKGKKKSKKKSLKSKVWDECSKWVRYQYSIDGENGQCYTCGAWLPITYLQAGHAIPGRHNAVLFDITLIRPQCVSCNFFNKGMYGRFAAKLIRENGQAWYDQKDREKSKGSSRIVKYTKAELEEMYDFFKHDRVPLLPRKNTVEQLAVPGEVK